MWAWLLMTHPWLGAWPVWAWDLCFQCRALLSSIMSSAQMLWVRLPTRLDGSKESETYADCQGCFRIHEQVPEAFSCPASLSLHVSIQGVSHFKLKLCFA